MTYVPVKYPSWRYHATEAARLVHTPDDDAALPAGWSESPATVGPVAPAPDPPPLTPPVAPAPAPVPDEEREALEFAAKAGALHAMKAADIIATIEVADDPEGIAAVRAMEEANPNGARKTILKALDARAAALGGVGGR